MIEQITLKNANISDKSLHLSVQKTYSHKQGNNHSLDRSEVTGSGKKLFKQKGTGNARAGNKKTTQRRGGGKAFGPKFHLVSFKVNKKVKNLALMSSISIKSNNKSLYSIDETKLRSSFSEAEEDKDAKVRNQHTFGNDLMSFHLHFNPLQSPRPRFRP